MSTFTTTKPPVVAAPTHSQPIYVIAYDPPLKDSIRYAEKLKFEGRYLESAAAYEQLIAKQPNNIDLRIGIIKVHFFFEEYNKAFHVIEEALKKFPNNPIFLYQKGRIFQE